jgi:hypothetical protein
LTAIHNNKLPFVKLKYLSPIRCRFPTTLALDEYPFFIIVNAAGQSITGLASPAIKKDLTNWSLQKLPILIKFITKYPLERTSHEHYAIAGI